jgi:hypothetical protein
MNGGEPAPPKLVPGERFPDLDLPDHTGRSRLLSEAAGGDPVALFFSRGWWCPKEQRYMRELARDPRYFADDPFARIFPGTVVRTSLFCEVPPPAGPAIERYRGVAWPGGRHPSIDDVA